MNAEQLKGAGFNDNEINQYRGTLSQAGFSVDEIDNYLGRQPGARITRYQVGGVQDYSTPRAMRPEWNAPEALPISQEIPTPIADKKMLSQAGFSESEINKYLSANRPWEHPVKEGLKGVGKEALQSFLPENIRKNLLAAGETAGSLATGMVGFVAGVPPLVVGGPKYGPKAAERVGKALTYQPATEQGKQLTGIVSKPFELITMGEDKFAEWAMSQYKTLEETEKEVGDKELAQILHNADFSPKTREWMARSIFRVGLLGLPLLKKVFGKAITPAEAVKEVVKNPEIAKELKIESPEQLTIEEASPIIGKIKPTEIPSPRYVFEEPTEAPKPTPQPENMILYHGSPAKVDKLEIGKPSPRDPSYRSAVISLTDDQKYAQRYAGKQGTVGEYTLDMKNPIDLGDGEATSTVATFLKKIGSPKSAEELKLNPTGWVEQWRMVSYNKDIVKILKDLGYDGAIWKENKGKSTAYSVFSPDQIKGKGTIKDGQEFVITPDETIKGKLLPYRGLEKLSQEQKRQVQTGAIRLPQKKTPGSPEVSFDPEIESAYQKSVAQPETLSLKVKDTFQSIWHKATREYEYLPKDAKFAEARFSLKQLEKQRGVAQEKTVRGIGETLSGLDKNEYDVFTRKVILDDLSNEAVAGHDLPWGLTHESLIKEKIKFDSVVEGSPKVQEAINKRTSMWNDLKTRYENAMNDIGVDVSGKIKNENYFRHQVLEYVNLNGIFGTGKKLKSPTYRGFLQKRKGSSLDINRDYLQPETEVMAQMEYDIQIANTIKRIEDIYDISDSVKKEAKKQGLTDWHKAIPEKHSTWQAREGNVFYMIDSIPAKLAEQLKSGALEKLGITEEDLKQIRAMGGKRKELVLPDELVATLDELVKQKTGSVLANADRKILRAWKIWTLISPRRYFKYNFRNLTGDADAAFVGNHSGFKKTPQATKELYDVIVDKKQMTPDMHDWFDRGGMPANLQAQEMGEFKNLWMFKRLYEQNKGIKDLPQELWKKYWRGARISTDMRESVLRYANYLDYLEQIKKDGKPKNYGASIPEEIMGLKEPKDQAYWLSNDLLGAYDRVSVMGQNLREYWVPFWSWKEVNFKRYIQFAKNAVNDRKLTSLIGNKALATVAKSPYIAYRIGSFMVKATALWSGLQVWNHTRFPDEEKELSVEERSKPHVILGRDENGKIISFNRMGALGDFLEWFGLDTAPHYVDAWFNGKMTLKDIAKDMAKSPVNVATSVITPFVKTPAELATRRTLYPDIIRPGTIRDKGLYLARNLGLENEYIAITGKPSEGYKTSLTKAFVYSTDPGQVAYSAVFDMKNEFLKKMGKGAEGFWLTPRGGTLYNLKLAIRYKDKEATDKYLGEYAKMGGTREGLKSSLEFMNPLSGMTKKEQTVFVLSLNDEDKKTLGRAVHFYLTTLLGNKEVQR